ncbi:Transposase and inactivated derivatives [uncultured Candidatus Thioglobus sp.]|nr:Transposase and inactivated derivatives [uncultured Candidatus Thioglobus sp.]
MPRQPRLIIKDQPHHIIQRGNNKQIIFVADEDYQFYLKTLKDACIKYHCHLHAYVLMTNHVHLLITPKSDDGVSAVMQYIGRIYVRYFNDLHQKTGTLWEGRYKSAVIDSENYLLTCYCYIEQNPLRAGMVKDINQYPWSSYHYHIKAHNDDLIQPHELYLLLGQNTKERCANYQSIFEQTIPEKTIKIIRDLTNKSFVLGTDRFIIQIEAQFKRRIKPKPKGGDRKSEKFKQQRKIRLL